MVLLNLLCFLALTSHATEPSPDVRAERIARAQPQARKLFKKLELEAARIRDRELRLQTLAMLAHPEFKVLDARRDREAEIVSRLRHEGLLDDSFGDKLFPTEPPQAFIAAPASGSAAGGHHVYPGGLVYHTAANLRQALAYCDTYQELQDARLDRDIVRAAALWHDSAKTLTLHWTADGTAVPGEPRIAATNAHHIWAVAEALYRGLSPKLVVSLASAHAAITDNDGKSLIGFLKAGAIIAGVPYEKAGLRPDGSALGAPAPIESYINHLSDADYSVMGASLAAVNAALDESTGPQDQWGRDEALAAHGDLGIFSRLLEGQRAPLPRASARLHR